MYSITPPMTGPSTRKEEGCCQEGHPSVKESQRRILSFNSTRMNARASPGDSHSPEWTDTRARATASRPMITVKEASWST